MVEVLRRSVNGFDSVQLQPRLAQPLHQHLDVRVVKEHALDQAVSARSKIGRQGEQLAHGLFRFSLLAKLAEWLDAEVYAATLGLVSGHSLKHVFAAAACYFTCF